MEETIPPQATSLNKLKKKKFDIRNFNNLKNQIIIEVTFAITVFTL
jgi:hypothetical protein